MTRKDEYVFENDDDMIAFLIDQLKRAAEIGRLLSQADEKIHPWIMSFLETSSANGDVLPDEIVAVFKEYIDIANQAKSKARDALLSLGVA